MKEIERRMALKRSWFSGGIPAELGRLTNLTYLSLMGNRFSGTIPYELSALTRLEQLNLSDNQLTGGIPFELGGLTRLKKLHLSANRFTGPIPAELGNLPLLEDLGLSRNRLSGRIPPELGNLVHLRHLSLSSNRLTGTIPAGLGGLSRMQQLHLTGNQLHGRIPTALAETKAYLVAVGYNALYTDNGILKMALDKRDSSDSRWFSTQTVAPAKVKAVSTAVGGVTVSWKTIPYKEDAGGYIVLYGPLSGGPWTEAGVTKDKSRHSMTVTGLTAGETYYFTVQTRTEAHPKNPNAIVSELSQPVKVKVK